MHLCKLILRILHELERMILQQQRSFSHNHEDCKILGGMADGSKLPGRYLSPGRRGHSLMIPPTVRYARVPEKRNLSTGEYGDQNTSDLELARIRGNSKRK